MTNGNKWSVPRKASQDDVDSASASFNSDVQWKKGHTQWYLEAKGKKLCNQNKPNNAARN